MTRLEIKYEIEQLRRAQALIEEANRLLDETYVDQPMYWSNLSLEDAVGDRLTQLENEFEYHGYHG